MKIAELQKPGAHPRALGDLPREILKENQNIDPFSLYPDLLRMHGEGTLAIALGSEAAAEAMLSSTKRACDDLTSHHAQVATQQALATRLIRRRRMVHMVATVLLALCILGLWLTLH
jgi:hypothetical protein